MNKVIQASAGLGLALCVSLAGCNRADTGNAAGNAAGAVDTAAIADTIKQMEQRELQDFGTKDPNRIVAFYAEDATVMLPGAAAMTGRDAILKGLGDTVKDPAFKLDFSNAKTEVAAAGDMAYTRGSYTVTYTNPQKKVVTEKGSYVTVFKKQSDGGWKAVEDINTPAGS
ncbi:MAG: YybH family protein [Sphingomonadales bacterium]